MLSLTGVIMEVLFLWWIMMRPYAIGWAAVHGASVSEETVGKRDTNKHKYSSSIYFNVYTSIHALYSLFNERIKCLTPHIQ